MKNRWKFFATATLARALNLPFASAALAHGGVPDGHSEQGSGLDWSILLVPPEFVLGGVALVGAFYPESAQGMSVLQKCGASVPGVQAAVSPT